LGRVAREESSPSSRVVHQYDPAGNETAVLVQVQRSYRDSAGAVRQTDWLTNATSYTYDPVDRRIQQVGVGDPPTAAGGMHDAVTPCAYDPLGRLVSKTDADREGTSSADDPRLADPGDPTFDSRFWAGDWYDPVLQTFLPSRSGRRVDYTYDA